MQAQPHERGSLRDWFVEDHKELDSLFDLVVEAFRDDDRERVRTLWDRFERRLAGHMAAEETSIFPRFEKDYPEEAAALKAEHGAIRAKLAEMGVGVDLHLVRADVVEAFMKLLRAHAEKEDGLLYRWADRTLEPSVRTRILERLTPLRAPSAPPR